MIVVGVGCSRGCSADEILALIDASLGEIGVTDEPVHALATVDRRADEPGVVDAARRRGWPLETFAAADLATVDVPTPSAVVAAHVGTPSVAEAAALLAAPGGALVLTKRRSPNATCAIARIPTFGEGPGPSAFLGIPASTLPKGPGTFGRVVEGLPVRSVHEEAPWPA